ncbi:MAG: sugar ABC transporter permease [Clostridiales bacterium]|nr:sugar ABC transporter permease [Clostridiales bacterium]
MVDSKHQWKAWLYLAPALVLLLVFTVWPIINTVRLAFLEGYNSLAAVNQEEVITFSVGIKNFQDVVNYHGFRTALVNTALLTVITVPLSTLLALLIAVALNSIKPLQKFFQTVFFLPYVTNSIAIGMVFAAMFNIVGNPNIARLTKSVGIINNIIEALGGTRVNWINAGSEYWANMVVLIVYIVWNALPFKILVLLGGLQSVNKQYYDAAKVDSTPRWRVFTKITVPLLSPMIAYVVITGFIGGFKEYTSIVGIFGETMGPPGASDSPLNTIVGMIYDVLPKQDYGLASAAALILFGIIFVVTMINMWVSKKRVHY